MSEEHPHRQRDFRDYLHVLRRRKLVVIVTVLVAAAGALTISALQTPTYAATAKLLLQPRVPEVVLDTTQSPAFDPNRTLLTEIQVIESLPVRERVLEEERQAPEVMATPVGQTDVVALRIESTDPELAARAANLYASAYIENRKAQDVQGLREAVAAVDQQILNLRASIAAATPPDRIALEDTLRRRQETRENLDLSIQSRTGGAQLVNPALVPDQPFRPNPVRNTVLALTVGLVIGCALALVRDTFDDSIKAKEDLERASGDLPTLGLIPVVASWQESGSPLVISIADPASQAAEAYRTLRTAIQFIGLNQAARVIQVTSPWAMEGKSTTTSNLGVAFARSGFHVVIVCCDLRRPRIHEFFGLSNAVGLTSVLLGQETLAGALQPVVEVPRLHLLASGPLPPNPSELLSSPLTGQALEPLAADGGIVIIDSPPVLPVTDSIVLSQWVDATLLVCAAGVTNRQEVGRTVELLRQVRAPLIGTVLNGVHDGADYYGYAYSERYQALPESGVPAGSDSPGQNGKKADHGRKASRRQ